MEPTVTRGAPAWLADPIQNNRVTAIDAKPKMVPQVRASVRS